MGWFQRAWGRAVGVWSCMAAPSLSRQRVPADRGGAGRVGMLASALLSEHLPPVIRALLFLGTVTTNPCGLHNLSHALSGAHRPSGVSPGFSPGG